MTRPEITEQKELLMQFLDWYDPEASHRDIGLDGVVSAFFREQGL
jgi:hypothetical protein